MQASRAFSKFMWVMTAAAMFIPGASLGARLEGSVRDVASLRPVAFANVIVIGTPIGTMVDQDGKFVIEGLEEGLHEIRVSFVGYEPLQRTVRMPIDSTVAFLLEEWGAAVRKSFVDSIGCALSQKNVKLSCKIVSAKPVYRVGERLDFHVRIRNEGDTVVFLPRFLEGSPRAARFPVVQIEVSGDVQSREGLYCAWVEPLSESDFVRLEPGAEFDPYADGISPHDLLEGVTVKAGTHSVRFRYSTDSEDVTRWLGFPNKNLTREVAAFLKHTPRVELESMTEIEIVD